MNSQQPWPGRPLLNWRNEPGHWGGGRRRPCRFCGRLSFLLDDDGKPVHKVCLEQAIAAALTAQPEGEAA